MQKYNVIFYEKENGKSPVRDYLDELLKKPTKNKDVRIKKEKIIAYIDALAEKGTRIGMPATRYLGNEIWELRPLSDRILYFFFQNNEFVLLHHFVKKTQKTPQREIEQAKKNMIDYINRKG